MLEEEENGNGNDEVSSLKRTSRVTRMDNVKRKRLDESAEFKLSTDKKVVYVKEKSTKQHDHYDIKVETLEDLIIIDNYYVNMHVNKYKSTNIQFSAIHRIVPSIKKFLRMVGLDDVKRQILEMIVFFLQRFDRDNKDFLHTVVYGGPGVGKTALIEILAEIYAQLGVLKTSKVKSVKRADLIGQYLGHTAAKTKKVIEEALGGVLLIDEAYSLGDTEGKDSFSRECIDTLNQYLSERKSEFICIIAGYKEDLDRRFFHSNPGLERRFPFRINISDYKASELRRIFMSIVQNQDWAIAESEAPLSLFEKNACYFKFNGGDMETLFTRVKFIHSMRVFGEDPVQRKKITKEDLVEGMKTFTSIDNVKGRKKDEDLLRHLYM